MVNQRPTKTVNANILDQSRLIRTKEQQQMVNKMDAMLKHGDTKIDVGIFQDEMCRRQVWDHM